jgi:enamine deaminase RidA (YjgF/YER057c/UK114 family)
MTRRLISSGGPFEATFGYSRAVVVGDTCWVAGTTDVGADGASEHPGDVAGQTWAAFERIERALVDGGFTLADVVRTRMFIVDIADAETVGAVHGQIFGEIRPASTMAQVVALIHPSLRIEIEAEARRT